MKSVGPDSPSSRCQGHVLDRVSNHLLLKSQNSGKTLYHGPRVTGLQKKVLRRKRGKALLGRGGILGSLEAQLRGGFLSLTVGYPQEQRGHGGTWRRQRQGQNKDVAPAGVSLSLVAWAARRDWVPPEGKELALCSPLLSVIGSRLALRGES